MRSGVLAILSLAACACLPATASAQTAPAGTVRANDNRRCLFCHGRDDFKDKVRQDGKKGLFVNGGEFASSIHGRRNCWECHADAAEVPHQPGLKTVLCGRCHYVGNTVGAPASRRYKQYEESVHGQLVAAGDPRAPRCQNCHGTHSIRPADDPNSRVYRRNIADDCGQCHAGPRREYSQSIHGVEAAKGNLDVPTCIDCHSEHSIRRHQDPASTVHPSHIPSNCGRCHEDQQVMNRYGIGAEKVGTYKESFHGVALKFGVMTVANCTSCHGNHDIRPRSDPASSIHPDNLARTCGKGGCHTGATANFGHGRIHVSAHEESAGKVYWVALAFKWLTITVMCGLMLHILLDLARRAINRLRRRPTEQRHSHPDGRTAELLGTPVKRLDLFVRVQHANMAVSCILLIVSGIPVKFHDAAWAESVMDMVGGIQVTGFIHRVAATVLIAVSLAHLAYISLTRPGRRNFLAMVPRPCDVVDLLRNLSYFVGISDRKPLFDRFSYLEKFDYWAVYWGMVVMALSGLALWFETEAMSFLPKEWLDIAKEVHSDEAMLATLAIVFWHFFNAHFNPDKFPMNPVFWHGMTNVGQMLEEHPRELARLTARGVVDRAILEELATSEPRALDVLEMAFPAARRTV